MTKAEPVSHVAAETSATKAAAERTAGAGFSTIVGALARDERVAIAGSRSSPSEAASRVADAIPEPGSRSPPRRRRCRLSSQRTPSEKQSTNSMMGQAVTCAPSVSATRRPHVRAFEAQRSRGKFREASQERTHAHERAHLESLRARFSNVAGCGFAPATVLCAVALQLKGVRSLAGAGRLTVQHFPRKQPTGLCVPRSIGAHSHFTDTANHATRLQS